MAARPVGVAVHDVGHRRIERRLDFIGLIAGAFQDPRAFGEPGGVVSRGARRALEQVFGPFEKLAGNVLSRLGFLGEFSQPRGEQVHPCFDGVFVTSARLGVKRPAPTVVDQRGHGNFGPDRRAQGAVKDHRTDNVMPLGENVGGNGNLFPQHPLDGESAGVNLGRDPFDDHSRGGFPPRFQSTPPRSSNTRHAKTLNRCRSPRRDRAATADARCMIMTYSAGAFTLPAIKSGWTSLKTTPGSRTAFGRP